MSHFPKPFFRKSRNLWYVQVDGKQHNLGPDREVAFDRYHALMRQPAAKKVASDCVSSILDAFLDWTQQNRAPATYEWYVERTSSFCKTLPADMRASDLKPLHVQRWLDQHPKWNNGMKRGAITAIKRAFHWAEKMGYVDRSPVAHMEKPQGGRRENVVTPAQYKELLTHVNDDAFRELLDTSWECGCRPQESLHVEARHVDRQNSRWVFPADESKGKKRIRVVYLTPNAALSKLIWTTLCEQDDDSWASARYRNNSSCSLRTAPSQLACVLRDNAWIPQTDGRFVRPVEATRDLLPNGFPFDPGWEWLATIGFGQRLVERSEEDLQRRAMARRLGFGDDDTLERAKRFATLPAEAQRRILAEQEVRFEPPDQEPVNPRRRAERVAAQAAAAPERTTEERTRSVSINRDAVKQEAGQYLRQQYTNTDGQMMCQVCKKRLPFQLDDGTDYFERVEFLPTLNRHHKENYLALCPNHAAMFQHANGSSEELRDLVMHMVGNTLPVVLAKEEMTIYFTKTHLADLKVVIGADEGGTEQTGDDVIDETVSASSIGARKSSETTEIGAQE